MNGSSDNGNAFANSEKVYIRGRDSVRVPARKIHLDNGEPPVYVYDTSGPQGHDVREGLPPLRRPWIEAEAALRRYLLRISRKIRRLRKSRSD